MARNAVELTFTGDAGQLSKTFDSVGVGATQMSGKVDTASRNVGSGFDKMGDGADAGEQRIIGLRDAITGTGDVMTGLKEGNIALLLTGFADIGSSIANFVVPALAKIGPMIMTSVAPALTAISAHPLVAALLIGGAIIGGLILLEKKFGIVSGAVGFVKDKFGEFWDFIRPIITTLGDVMAPVAGLITMPYRLAFRAIKLLWNNTIGGFRFSVPDWIPGVGGKGFSIPKMHTGGVVPGMPGQESLALLTAGERVIPAGRGGGGTTVVVNVSGVGMGRDFGQAVAQALRDNRLIGVS